jgi:DNA-binding transcriptional LysR family regulator
MFRLSLEALQIVDAIDRRGSFSAAGKELHRVPSTISYTVNKLEDDLGVQVFERHGPRVVLTAAGAELLKEGRYLLRAAQDLEHRVRRVASGWETELTVGMDSMFAACALQDDISAFYGLGQQTRLRLMQEALSGTWEALLDRRADLLIGAAGEGPAGGGYVSHALGQMEFVFAWHLAIRWQPRRSCWNGAICSLTAPSAWPIRRASCRRARWACCWGRTAERARHAEQAALPAGWHGFRFSARALCPRGDSGRPAGGKGCGRAQAAGNLLSGLAYGEMGAALAWWLERWQQPQRFARLGFAAACLDIKQALSSCCSNC